MDTQSLSRIKPSDDDGKAVLGSGDDDDDDLFRPEFISPDWQIQPTAGAFRPNFQPVMKADCTACHQSDRVSQGCTTCHNYHVTDTPR